ncbi:SNAPc like transcription factor [Cryptosporidium ryanae]|uniref:SNAPc like transcription factor n=1 Tax=Cryptosporidium ryanae TaxID=515981 RepID=UPI00351A4D6A|nr:SNAPc like transcription factor [Cryptosporidium ryanae]
MEEIILEVLDSISEIDKRNSFLREKLVEFEINKWQRDLVNNYGATMRAITKQKHRVNDCDRFRFMTRLMDIDGNYPLSNDDTIIKNNLRRNLPNYRMKYEWNNNIWLPSEIDKLKNLVKIHILKSILEIKVKLGMNVNENISNNGIDDINISSKFLELNTLLKNLHNKNSGFNIEEYWVEFWNMISLDLGGRCERTGRDCQITWYHYIDPNTNRTEWTKSEDLRLLSLVSEYKGYNWMKISQILNTGRTPYQCIYRYQRCLNKNLIKSAWSNDEDNKLISIVDSLGGISILEMNKRSTSKWNYIASLLPGRTNQQCRTRYVRSLKKNLKHGSWSLYEDVRLQFAYFVYGGNSWTKISKHINGRSDSKCRERYVNMLKPDIKKGKWSEEENNLLISTVKKFGPGNWSLIKNYIIGRTDSDCSKQWEKLDINSSIEYDILRATQGKLLPNSYKWIGLMRSNHKYLNSNFDKHNIVKPVLTGSDFLVESNQNILNIAHSILNLCNEDIGQDSTGVNIAIQELIKKIQDYNKGDQYNNQILLKIKRSLVNFVKRKKGIDLSSVL